jgi:hypothetical protein
MPIFSSKNRYTWILALALPVMATTSCSAGRGENVGSQGDDPLSAAEDEPHRAVCADAPAGYARCHARVRVTPQGAVKVFASPSGLTPADLQSAYALPTSGGSGMTIAIVDAQDNPNAEKDLAVYRQQFGLSPCTTTNGCFKKVNQSGQPTPLPTPDTGWAGEIALDLDMASAACPSCKILLVEANSASMSDLGAAVNAAVKLGANVVSNSYGGSEDSSAPTTDQQYFNHAGVTITASSGDGGYGVEYPAASKYVLAVGGTSLTKASNTRGWSEKAWSGAGSGCSKYETKPSFQTDTGCGKRTVADVSAVADPNTGVAVYNTYGGSGWAVYGGTSASSPLVAAILALTGKANVGNGWPYAHTGAFFDVTSGSNGSCGGSYLCTGTAGYDGPTGLGTPNGALIASGGGGGGGDAGTDSGGGDSGGGDAGTDSGGGGGSCAHPICSSGSKLTSGCDPCATKVCASDSYCCTTAWDSICVGEVSSICGQSCGGGSCAHPICSTGSKLASGCDPCATKICAADSYCCTTQWDSICVGEVKSICGQTCQ